MEAPGAGPFRRQFTTALDRSHWLVMVLLPAAITLGAGAIMLAYRTRPLVALIAAAGLVFSAVAVARPLWGVYLGIALIPLQSSSVNLGSYAADLTPSKTVLMVAGAGWLVQRLGRRQPILVDSPLTKPFALSLLALVPGVAIAANRTNVLKVLALWTVFFVAYQIVVAEGSRTAVRRLLLVLALAGAVVALIAATGGGNVQSAVIQRGAGTGPTAVRATGPFISPNILAAFMELSLPGAVVLALRGPVGWRVVLIPAAALMTYALVLSLSRGGLAGGLAATVVMLAWRPFRRVAAVGAIVLLVLVAVVGLPVFVGGAWPALAHRLSTLLSGAQHDPRIQIWGAAVSTFAHHPLFGVGAENLTFGLNLADPNVASQSPVGVAYYQFGVHAHDLFLTMAAERGVLGLGAFLWVCFALARVIQTGLGHAKEAERGLVLAIAASLTAVLAHGLVDYTLVDVIAASIMTLAGCAVVMSRRVPEAGPELHAQSS